MTIKYLNESDTQRWDDYVDNHTEGTLYHKSTWLSIYKNTFKQQPVYLFAESNGQIAGIAPLVKFKSPIAGKVLISLPFVNYGGLLYSNEHARVTLLEKINELRLEEGCSSVELRARQAAEYDLPSKDNKVTFILDLPESAELLNAQFKAKLRSQIRRPLKEGMHAKSGGLELLDDFYFVFCRNMRDLGTPVTGKNVFKTLLTEYPEHAHIVTVYTQDNQAAASAFLLGFNKTMEIPWASALRKFNRFSPNMLLYWEVLSLAIDKGYSKFDFGRGTKEGGTYKFKKQWGGREKQLYWYYILDQDRELPQVNKENPKYAMAINLWQKLPLPLANLLGPKIAIHLP